MKVLLGLLLFSHFLQAEVGKVIRISGGEEAYLQRGQNQIRLVTGTTLEKEDEVHSLNALVTLTLYPTTQIALAKQTQIKISQNLIEEALAGEKSTSVIDFIKGLVRVMVTKDEELQVAQEVRAQGVSFGVRGTEFEVSQDNGEVNLDVIEGEVEARSPDIQTFVPEMVKANQGLRFNRKGLRFERREFRQRMREQAGFMPAAEVRKRWRVYRQGLRQKRLEAKAAREGHRQQRKELREQKRMEKREQREQREQRRQERGGRRQR